MMNRINTTNVPKPPSSKQFVPLPPTQTLGQSPTTSTPQPPTTPVFSRKELYDRDGFKQDVRLKHFSPIKKTGKRPNMEGLRLLHAIDSPNPVKTYPKKARTDVQKFNCLAQMFHKEEVDRDMFLEFSDVLKIEKAPFQKEKAVLIAEVLEAKAVHDLKIILTNTLEANKK